MITASAMMKMQVPAYCPFVPGVHSVEKRGVLKETKKVMAMSAMLIDILESDMSMSMEEVDVAMDIPVDVAVDMDIVIWDISIFGGLEGGLI